jgi:hypothetical protein
MEDSLYLIFKDIKISAKCLMLPSEHSSVVDYLAQVRNEKELSQSISLHFTFGKDTNMFSMENNQVGVYDRNTISWDSFFHFTLGVNSPPRICVRSSQEMIFWIFDIKSRIAHLFKGEEDAMLALYDHLE